MTDAEVLRVAPAEIAAAVSDREFRRLMALPRTGDLPEGVLQSMRDARQWYSIHGDPFVATRRVEVAAIGAASVTLATGAALPGRAIASLLSAQDSHAVVAVAVSAGPRVAAEAAHSWSADRPDAGYALDRFAAAVAEGLLRHAFTRLCDSLLPEREQLTRHLSPGCGHWDIAHQRDVMDLLTGPRLARLGPMTLLESGALDPQHSMLAVSGVTRHGRSLTPGAACLACDLDPCTLRRMPFAGDGARQRVNP
ncbi:MAG: hypothetical protein FIB04_14500 [Gammaproteobacteria bacterium]|nr:hypothetical protein [Gammaproteobacteria bacterium]